MSGLLRRCAWMCACLVACTFDPSGDPSAATMVPSEGPLLEFEQGAAFEFGGVDWRASATEEFVVANVGSESATDVVLATTGGPFVLGFNACPTILDAGERCSVQVVLTPVTFGEFGGTLTLDYGSPSTRAELELFGVGVGATENLLVNGDGELPGRPPPGWIEIGEGDWRADGTTAIPPHSGDRQIWAGYPRGGGEFEVQQSVELGSWVGRTSAGAFEVNLEGWGQSWPDDADRYRIAVEFDAAVGAGWDSDWQAEDVWTRYGASVAVPVGASRALVRLRCQHAEGEACNAHFDDVLLTLSYGR